MNELNRIKKLEGYTIFGGYEVVFENRHQFEWLKEQAEVVNNKQLKQIKEAFEQRYNRSFTNSEVISHCLGIIHNGVFKKGWSLNGEKMINS